MPFNGNSFGGYFSGYFGYKNLSADAYLGYYSNYLYSIYSKSIEKYNQLLTLVGQSLSPGDYQLQRILFFGLEDTQNHG